jgi:iron complex outermembrane receptor protein
MNLSPDIDFDVTVRGVAALASPAVSGYSTADLRLAWRPRAGVELALLARNLGDGGHGEFTSIATRTEIGRGVYATVRWDFGTP